MTAAGVHFDTVLEGRRSYEIGLRAGLADAYPHVRHLVFSRSLPASDAVEIVSGDVLGLVRDLKQQDGKDIWLVGGGALAGALRPEIDQLVLKLAPMTVGSGIPLFGRDAGFEPHGWQLTHHKVLESGTIFLTYSASTPA